MTKTIQHATVAMICICLALAAGSFLLYELVFRREMKTLADSAPPRAKSVPASGCMPAERADSASELRMVLPLIENEEHVPDQIARLTICPAPRQKNLARELTEIALGLQIRLHFNHRERAVIYLNRVYFGDGAYGIEQAAQHYFGVPAVSLTLSQSALLVGLIRAPSWSSPYLHPDRALARRNAVLQSAFAAGRISDSDLASASASPLGVR